MAGNHPNKKVANRLVAMSSAAVLAVYAAGYTRTRSAADRIAEQVSERMIARQAPSVAEGRDAGFHPAESISRVDSVIRVPDSKRAPAIQPRGNLILVNVPQAIASSASVHEPNPMPNSATVQPAAVETPAPALISAVAIQAASVAVEAPATVPPADSAVPALAQYRDGMYAGWGRCQHGDIQATVVIEGGRIVKAEISKCRTRYSCDVIEKLPPQVVQRQSHTVDLVGGATESADAFYTAVFNALSQAK